MLSQGIGDGPVKSGAGIGEGSAMAYAETGGGAIAELGGTLRGELRIPGKESREGKRELKDSSDEEAVLCAEGITSKQRMISSVDKGEMAGSVARRTQGHEGADWIAVV